MLRPKLAIAAVVVVCSVGATATAAYAMFSSSGSAIEAISTQTLQPPTSVAAALTSLCNKNKTQQVTVTWTASTSAFATGYTIQRNSTTVATVSAATTSWIDNTVAHSTAYTYTVLATYKSWSSGANAPAVTTC
jgi:1-aminocyclopropane-1-carboxylate deaminase/D-cysteine desulfhydrase-like pyridoxal-dependent ACC family enzyme